MIKRLLLATAALVAVLVIGAIGYMLIEERSLADALYMTVITVSTVGYREVWEPSQAGRVFTMFLIVTGFGAVLFSVGTFVDFVVEGHLRDFVEGRRMTSRLEQMKGHYIVAGIGRVGSVVARMLAEENAPFVVVDQGSDAVVSARENGWLIVKGDATDESVLSEAGIERASGLVTALDTDADNLFVAFTGRAMNPDLFIVARSSHESSEGKLLRAGANRVLTPNVIGGRRMVTMMLHPVVADYLDLVTHGNQVEFRLQEMDVVSGSSYAGRTIKEARVRDETGVYILAVCTADGTINTNPSAETVMTPGDKLVVLGTQQQLESLMQAM